MTHTSKPPRCPCCGHLFSLEDKRHRTCQCSPETCAGCGKCTAHCTCKPASRPNTFREWLEQDRREADAIKGMEWRYPPGSRTHQSKNDRLEINLLQFAWQHDTISLVALPINAEVRNGQFRNGGLDQRSWLDTDKAQTSQSRARLRLRFSKRGRQNGRALHRSTQQNWRVNTGTSRFQTSNNQEEVSGLAFLSSASAAYEIADPKQQTVTHYLVAYFRRCMATRQGNGVGRRDSL